MVALTIHPDLLTPDLQHQTHQAMTPHPFSTALLTPDLDQFQNILTNKVADRHGHQTPSRHAELYPIATSIMCERARLMCTAVCACHTCPLCTHMLHNMLQPFIVYPSREPCCTHTTRHTAHLWLWVSHICSCTNQSHCLSAWSIHFDELKLLSGARCFGVRRPLS